MSVGTKRTRIFGILYLYVSSVEDDDPASSTSKSVRVRCARGTAGVEYESFAVELISSVKRAGEFLYRFPTHHGVSVESNAVNRDPSG